MVIFHSYVSLPEGKHAHFGQFLGGSCGSQGGSSSRNVINISSCITGDRGGDLSVVPTVRVILF
jgi:hypothetical protein